VLFLNRDATVKAEQKVSQTQGGFGGTLSDGDRFGAGFARLGDLDGDKVTELAVWAPRDDGAGGTWRGAVWILFLRANGTVKDQVKIGDGSGGFPGGLLADFDVLGLPTAPGDLDGDGVADLVVSAFLDDGAGIDRGALWVLFLNADGTVRTSPPPRRITEGTSGLPLGLFDDEDYFGADPAAVGDVNGDGVTDLVVGAALDDDGTGDDHGAAYVLFLDAAPAVCGNGVLDPLEECDDGGNLSGDLCSASCERETWMRIGGSSSTASGGSFEVTVDGILVAQPTTAGQTAGEVLVALAAAIEAADPALEAVVNGDILYTNGTITQVSDSDFNLSGTQVFGLGNLMLQTLTVEPRRYAGVSLSASKLTLPVFEATPNGYAHNILWILPPSGTDRAVVAEPQSSRNPASVSLSIARSDSYHLLTPLQTGNPLSPPHVPISGFLRFCIFGTCSASFVVDATLPFLQTGSVMAQIGVGGTVTAAPTLFGFAPEAAFAPWTRGTVTLSSSLTPTVMATGVFAHGPLSNSVSLGLTGGVLQMVTPTQISSGGSVVADMGLVTRLTIQFLPEPAMGLLLGTGAVFMLMLGRRRMQR
jgi:cysteine-rich repeat protein